MGKDSSFHSITGYGSGGKVVLDAVTFLMSSFPAVFLLRQGDAVGWVWVVVTALWGLNTCGSYLDWHRRAHNDIASRGKSDQSSAKQQ